jgi:hypothetical protein
MTIGGLKIPREIRCPSRPDYEVPTRAIVDYLQTRTDIDSSRIGILGISLGGYYAPRSNQGSRLASLGVRSETVVRSGSIAGLVDPRASPFFFHPITELKRAIPIAVRRMDHRCSRERRKCRRCPGRKHLEAAQGGCVLANRDSRRSAVRRRPNPHRRPSESFAKYRRGTKESKAMVRWSHQSQDDPVLFTSRLNGPGSHDLRLAEVTMTNSKLSALPAYSIASRRSGSENTMGLIGLMSS